MDMLGHGAKGQRCSKQSGQVSSGRQTKDCRKPVQHITMSFLASNERVATFTTARSRSKTIEAHTCTHEPFIQGLVDSEAAANLQHFFSVAVRLAQRFCGVDLQTQVWQLHKDFGGGLERARKEVFRNSRPCDDYAHIRRASYKVLQQYLNASYPFEP